MRLLPLILVLATVFAVPAHGNALTSYARTVNKQNEANGIPFRLETKKFHDGTIMTTRMLPLPVGPSKADAKLTSDTLASISQKEHESKRGDAALEEVRLMPDGREVWILKSDDGGLAYVVHFQNATQGGVDITLLGPYKFAR